MVGWARKASTGLAGLARHDGELGARQAIEFLKNAPDSNTMTESEIGVQLTGSGIRIVDKQDLSLLARAEQRKGPIASPNSFHFIEEEGIFDAIDEERGRETRAKNTPEVAAD